MKQYQLIGCACLILMSQSGVALAEGKSCFELEAIGGDDKDATKVLDQFSVKIAGDTTLVSSEILSAYSPLSSNQGSLWIPKTLGVRLSASLPGDSVEIQDYVNTQLLLRDGGLLNGYFSLNTAVSWFDDGCANANNGQLDGGSKYLRQYTPDRVFMRTFPLPDTLLPYFTHGLGIKAIRKELENDGANTAANQDSNSIAAAGVFYLGFGVEGPMFNVNSSDKTAKGNFQFEVAGMATKASQDVIDVAYGTGIDNDVIYSFTGNLELFVSDAVSLSISYNAPLGDAKDFADEVTTFTIAYNR